VLPSRCGDSHKLYSPQRLWLEQPLSLSGVGTVDPVDLIFFDIAASGVMRAGDTALVLCTHFQQRYSTDTARVTRRPASLTLGAAR
jgi:hypothetical protein